MVIKEDKMINFSSRVKVEGEKSELAKTTENSVLRNSGLSLGKEGKAIKQIITKTESLKPSLSGGNLELVNPLKGGLKKNKKEKTERGSSGGGLKQSLSKLSLQKGSEAQTFSLPLKHSLRGSAKGSQVKLEDSKGKKGLEPISPLESFPRQWRFGGSQFGKGKSKRGLGSVEDFHFSAREASSENKTISEGVDSPVKTQKFSKEAIGTKLNSKKKAKGSLRKLIPQFVTLQTPLEGQATLLNQSEAKRGSLEIGRKLKHPVSGTQEPGFAKQVWGGLVKQSNPAVFDKKYKTPFKKGSSFARGLSNLRLTPENLREEKVLNQGLTSRVFGLYPMAFSEDLRKELGNLGVHPHNYSSLLGYRKGVPVVNNQKTLQDIRRVLNYLKKVIHSKIIDSVNPDSKMELLVILDNVPNLDTAEGQNNYLNLISLTLARINSLSSGGGLVILPKTMKDAIRYLTSRATVPIISSKPQKLVYSSLSKGSISSRKDPRTHDEGYNPENLCGVLMINPAKSKLSELANLVFAKNGKNMSSAQSSLGAIGRLCAKKGIPLISLCDLSSPLTYCTYPIICNTRNLSEVYLVLDLLSYGLNQIVLGDADLNL
jgi:hypothetical protein